MASNDDAIRRILMEVLSDPMNLPSVFWDYATQSWIKDAPVFPISQVFGFTQFTVKDSTFISTEENVTSTTYANLTTTGPTLTGLGDGRYLFLFGSAGARVAVGTGISRMSIQVNGTTASDVDCLLINQTTYCSPMRATVKTLSAGDNTVTAKYRVDTGGDTGAYGGRWLMALKAQNL